MNSNDLDNVEQRLHNLHNPEPKPLFTRKRKHPLDAGEISEKLFSDKLRQFCRQNKIKIDTVDSNWKYLKPNHEMIDSFQFIDKYPNCMQLIKTAGAICKNSNSICKYGSTIIRVAENKDDILRIYVRRKKYERLEFNNILAVYNFVERESNHMERLLVNTMRIIGLSGNALSDKGDYNNRDAKEMHHLRVLYALPLYITSLDLEPAEDFRYKTLKHCILNVNRIHRYDKSDKYDKRLNKTKHICNVIFMELSGRNAYACLICRKSGVGDHKHTCSYRDIDDVDLGDPRTLNSNARDDILDVMSNMHSTIRIKTIQEIYRETIKYWSNYADNNFHGRKTVLKSSKQFFSIVSHEKWYQRKDKKNVFESDCYMKSNIRKSSFDGKFHCSYKHTTRNSYNNDKRNYTTECTFDKKDGLFDHYVKNHYNELYNNDVAEIVLNEIKLVKWKILK